MTTVVLGCDENDENDATCQKTVHDAIKSAGFEVKDLAIDRNAFGNYSWSGEAKGKIGVYLMAGSLISFLDASDGYFDYNIFGIRGDVSSLGTEEGFKTKGVPQDHDGNYSHPRYDECAGKTYPQLNELFKGKCIAVPGDNHQDLAKNIVSALNGSYVGDSSNQNQQTEDEEEEWDDKDNFTPHKGKIMEIKPYKEISSISFDKSYDSPTGQGNVEVLFNSKDYRFLYKGVAMKLKLRRTCDGQFTATGVEEPDYDEDEKFFKEHVPTNELLEELGLPNYRKQRPLATPSTDSSGVSGASSDDSGTDSSTDDSDSSTVSSSSNVGSNSSSGGGSANRTTSGKRRLSRNYINSIMPSHASILAKRTNEFDDVTIKALRRRAIGLYW